MGECFVGVLGVVFDELDYVGFDVGVDDPLCDGEVDGEGVGTLDGFWMSVVHDEVWWWDVVGLWFGCFPVVVGHLTREWFAVCG